jgi:hypothetical protein
VGALRRSCSRHCPIPMLKFGSRRLSRLCDCALRLRRRLPFFGWASVRRASAWPLVKLLTQCLTPRLCSRLLGRSGILIPLCDLLERTHLDRLDRLRLLRRFLASSMTGRLTFALKWLVHSLGLVILALSCRSLERFRTLCLMFDKLLSARLVISETLTLLRHYCSLFATTCLK